MCNRYALEGSFYDIAGNYQAMFVGDCQIQGDIFPRSLAPGLLCNLDGERELHAMQFGIAPPNSETPSHPKFTSNNTRVEKPNVWPWQTAIETSRCVVPLSEFREPCYWGDPEGTEVYFSRADSNDLLHVAALYRLWKSPDGQQQLYTMSMLMKPACDYVMDHGHHRQPIFITRESIDDWLNPERIATNQAIQFLRDSLDEPALTHRHVRDMSPGWEKRKSGKVRNRGQQLQAMEQCPHRCGF